MHKLLISILTLIFPIFLILKFIKSTIKKPNQTETSFVSKAETNHESLFLQNLSEISYSLHLERKFKNPHENTHLAF